MAKKVAAPKKKTRPDPRVAEILSAIDVAREPAGIKTLEELTRRARGLPEDELPENASTWHGWRKGLYEPKFVDLADFAEVVGLTVGLIDYVPSRSADGTADEGVANVSGWMRKVETVMGRLPDHLQKEIYELAADHAARWKPTANPHEAADDAGHASSRRK